MHSGLTIDSLGNVIMVGYTKSFPSLNSGRSWVVKTDSIGNVKWYRTYSGIGSSTANGIRATPSGDGNVIISGGKSGNGYLQKIDTAGNEIWIKEYDVPEAQGLWDVKELEDGTIVSCGVTMGSDGSQAGWLIKTDSEGEMLWSRTFNPSSLVDFIRFMLVMENGDIVMLGDGRAPGQTNQDGWVLRVDSEGCLVEDCSVGVEELEEKTGYFTAYPNPATTEMTVSINRFDATDMELVVHDMMGKEVLRFRPIGDRSTVDMSNWSRGIYHCSFYGNRQLLQTEKLVLMSAP